MSALTLDLDKETLRNLAGPELFMQTGLEPLDYVGLEGVNGGSAASEAASAVASAVSSAAFGSVASAALSAAISGPVGNYLEELAKGNA